MQEVIPITQMGDVLEKMKRKRAHEIKVVCILAYRNIDAKREPESWRPAFNT